MHNLSLVGSTWYSFCQPFFLIKKGSDEINSGAKAQQKKETPYHPATNYWLSTKQQSHFAR